jgi:hypothetical protein
MRSVTIRIPAAKFCGTMTAMTEWLDVNGYEPTRYKYNHDEDAVLVTVDFSAGVAAKAFATRFDGIGRFPLEAASSDAQCQLPAEHEPSPLINVDD